MEFKRELQIGSIGINASLIAKLENNKNKLMSFFDILTRTAIQFGEKVKRDRKKATIIPTYTSNKTAEESRGMGANIPYVVRNGVDMIVDASDLEVEFVKEDVEELLEDPNFKKKLVDKSQKWVWDNKEEISTILDQIKMIKDTAGSKQLDKVKALILETKPVREVAVAMMALQAETSVSSMNKAARKIGPFVSWSAQLGVKANYALGYTATLGYAAPIFATTAEQVKGINSLGGNTGIQTEEGDCLWGWWKAFPEDLNALNMKVSIPLDYYEAKATLYIDLKGKIQGFMLALGSGEDEACVGVDESLVI